VRAASTTCNTIALAQFDIYATTHRCECLSGFAGDGYACAADSDFDGYADFSISSCSGQCAFCRQDACPSITAIAAAGNAVAFTTLGSGSSVQTNFIGNQSPANAAPNWILNSANSVSQTTRNTPTALTQGVEIGGFDYSVFANGTQPPSAANPDRGFMGVVFGFRGSNAFYVAQWKYSAPNNADVVADGAGFFGQAIGVTSVSLGGSNVYYSTAGLVLKRYYNSPSSYSLWNTNASVPVGSQAELVTGPIDFSSQFTTLYQDRTRTSWVLNTLYNFRVSYRPTTGYLRVHVTDPSGAIVQDTGVILGQTFYATGQLGVYSFIQRATFTQPSYRCCDGYYANGGAGDCLAYRTCPNGIQTLGTPTTNHVCNP